MPARRRCRVEARVDLPPERHGKQSSKPGLLHVEPDACRYEPTAQERTHPSASGFVDDLRACRRRDRDRRFRPVPCSPLDGPHFPTLCERRGAWTRRGAGRWTAGAGPLRLLHPLRPGGRWTRLWTDRLLRNVRNVARPADPVYRRSSRVSRTNDPVYRRSDHGWAGLPHAHELRCCCDSSRHPRSDRWPVVALWRACHAVLRQAYHPAPWQACRQSPVGAENQTEFGEPWPPSVATAPLPTRTIRQPERGPATTKPPRMRGFCAEKSRRRPTLPGGYPPSTIGADGLNCRVRNGNGCLSAAMATGNRALGARPRDPRREGSRASPA